MRSPRARGWARVGTSDFLRVRTVPRDGEEPTMKIRFNPTTLKLFRPSMTEFEAAAEASAWDIDNALASDALSPSDVPIPTRVGRQSRSRAVAGRYRRRDLLQGPSD
jgi:hypothetical protein